MIEVEHLSKDYGSTAAIADVSFSVESGEILGFLGPNGAGKTTTMRILSGYLPASSGTARIAGLDVHENSMEVRQRIGYLPENPPLYPEMTVEGFLFFVARIKQVPAGDRAQRVTSAIERCGLVDKRKVLIRKLSKGFRQRVGIAQAIVHDPPVIILDEPTVGLDPRQIIEVRNLIKSLGGQHTIILSTHILPEVSMTCNRVTIINRGKIVAAGTPENLMGELATGEGYEVEVEGEADLLNSLLLPSLENVQGVRSVELIRKQQFVAGRYHLRALCESDIEPGREIATAIIASGFGLCEMRRNQATLEDVFLRLTAAQNKPEETLVHSEPEVDRNLQATEIQDSIADVHQSEPQPIVENLPVSDRLESLYDSYSASEPVETVESIAHPEPEPIVETTESIELSPPESQPIVETTESIEHPQPESQPVVETVESIEHPEPEPILETTESIAHPEPEPILEITESIKGKHLSLGVTGTPASDSLQTSKLASRMLTFVKNIFHKSEILPIEPSPPAPVGENLEVVETEESIALSQPEPIVESIELSQPEPIVESIELSQPEPIVENLAIVEIVESIAHPEPEPIVENLAIVEIVESIAHPEPEPIVAIVESIAHPEPEPIVAIVESIEYSEPEPIVESIELSQPEPIVETTESLAFSQPEPIFETIEIINDLEPEVQSVAHFLELVERQESRANFQPEPIVENLEIPQIVESREISQPEPIVENLEIPQIVESRQPS
ncbi:ATP-binding cassette domain-containing protein, partial [Microcoleus sp. S36a_D1]|uniref:ABC transporter ATP-binding protein n=1 Tax=Microcoleus sp. S36a_D1 TaxID=3055416 RepID=UPI003FA603E5